MSCSGTERRRPARGEQGFILPTSLLVLTLLTVMLTAAFILVSAEFRTTDNSFASTRSLALAQAGLQSYFTAGHVLTGTSDSVNYTFPGGFAQVVARRLRDSTSSTKPMWIVRSTGFDTVRAPPGQPNSRRVVAQLAELDPGSLPGRAAMVAANGVRMSASGSNPIEGKNFGFTLSGCTIPGNPADDTVGLTVPTGDYWGSDPYPKGEGTNGMEQLVSATAVIDSTRIDWTRLLAGEFTPDYIGALPAAGNSTYQSHYFTGDVTIPSGQRRGLLVALGDVTLAAGAHWDGVIVAGGKLDANVNASYTVHGMVITGLNISQGQSVQENQVRRGGSRTIRWDWCYTRSSIGSLSSLIPLKNGWMDTWTTY